MTTAGHDLAALPERHKAGEQLVSASLPGQGPGAPPTRRRVSVSLEYANARSRSCLCPWNVV